MSGVSVLSPEPRRITTPGWLDLRLVLGVVLVLAAVLIGATVVSRAGDTRPSVTATRDLEPGTILTAADLRITQIKLSDTDDHVYLRRVQDAIGKSLDRRVSKDELLPAGSVEKVTARTTVALPLASGTAPRLHDGERIELWVSTKSCAAVVLLPDVTVQDVRTTDDGSFGSGSGEQDIVISVTPALSRRVVAALAIDGAQIRAGVLVGGDPTSIPTLGVPSAVAPAPGVVPSAGAPTTGSTVGQLPPDLAACAAVDPVR